MMVPPFEHAGMSSVAFDGHICVLCKLCELKLIMLRYVAAKILKNLSNFGHFCKI